MKRTTKQVKFLAAYAACGTVSAAARLAGVARTSHARWMNDGGYADAFREAQVQACEAVEAEIRRRAMEGVEEPVYYRGEQVGSIRRHSDALLMFLAKALMPDKYRDNVAATADARSDIIVRIRYPEDRDDGEADAV